MALVLSDEEVAMLIPEGKTKQEEIRERMAIQCYTNAIMVMFDQKVPLEPRDWHELLIDQRDFYRKQADEILHYLHSQGVVIKVDRELPVSIPVLPKFHKQGIITDDDLLEYARFTEVLNRMEYIKAGFEAVETIAPSDAAMSR